jgi:hypothetical protein
MFSKTAVVVSTAAILGAGNVTKSLARQMFYLGIPKVYKLQYTVVATSWDGVDHKIKNKITTQTDKVAHKILSSKGYATPGIKTRFLFSMLRRYHKNNDLLLFAPDKKYWIDNKWLEKERPRKRT